MAELKAQKGMKMKKSQTEKKAFLFAVDSTNIFTGIMSMWSPKKDMGVFQ